MDFSVRLLECPYDSKNLWSKREQEEVHNAYYNIVSKVMHLHFQQSIHEKQILLGLGSTFCMEWTFLEEKYWMRDKEDEEGYERPISLENLLTYFKTTISEDPFLSSSACPCPPYHIVPPKDTI